MSNPFQIYTIFGAAVFIAVVISIFIVLLFWYFKLKKIKQNIPEIELNTREDLKKINFDENYVERRLVKENGNTEKEIYKGRYGGERTTGVTKDGGSEGDRTKEQGTGTPTTTTKINISRRGFQEPIDNEERVQIPSDKKFKWD